MSHYSQSELTLVHSSDLHIDNDYTANLNNGDGAAGLRRVLKASSEVSADIVLLAGDVFEHNRLPQTLLDQVKEIFNEAQQQIVILPGNHDPLIEASVYHRGNFTEAPNVNVLGLSHETSIEFDDLDIEIWGNAHFDYSNMSPLRNPTARKYQWHVAIAHGHYDNAPHEDPTRRPAWLFGDEEIKALEVDYLALGHWDAARAVGPHDIQAHYCGSAEYAKSVNVVQLSPKFGVNISKHHLD